MPEAKTTDILTSLEDSIKKTGDVADAPKVSDLVLTSSKPKAELKPVPETPKETP